MKSIQVVKAPTINYSEKTTSIAAIDPNLNTIPKLNKLTTQLQENLTSISTNNQII